MTGDREREVLAAFVTGALLAGGNSVAIRFSNRELAPLWGAGLRFLLAAVLLVALVAALKLAFPRGRALTGSLLYGLVQFGGAFGFYYYALVRVHAGLGQTLLALIPLATLFLAVVQHQERFRTAALLGTLLGLIGVGLISHDPLHKSVPLVSLLAVFGSVLCFAEAAVLVRRFPRVHPVAMNAVGMMASGAVLVGASALVGEPRVLPGRFATWVALGYVAAIGSVVVFLLYLFVLQHWAAWGVRVRAHSVHHRGPLRMARRRTRGRGTSTRGSPNPNRRLRRRAASRASFPDTRRSPPAR